MTERATCWSITINNPKFEDYIVVLPVGWKQQGQIEEGAEGTRHYQGMLKTPQVRFSQVKKYFPRAHIEVARNPDALAQYVRKEETRVAVVESVPTLFEYQGKVANDWNEDEWKEISKDIPAEKIEDAALLYVDRIVKKHIEAGVRGAEFIAINPMWRSSWKKFWRSIIIRNGLSSEGSSHAETPQQAPCTASDSEGCSGSTGGSSVSGDVPADTTECSG